MASQRRAGGHAALLLALLLSLGGLLSTWVPEASSAPAAPGATTSPSAVYRWANGFYDDVTNPATNAAENDVTVSATVGDALYIGFERPFDQLELRVGTGRDGGGVVWEYHAGGPWVELVPSDASDGVSRTGVRTVAWNPPPQWYRNTLDPEEAPGDFYYIRLRTTQRLDGVARLSHIALEAWESVPKLWSYAAQAWGAPPAPVAADLQDIAIRPGLALAVAQDGSITRSTDAGDRWARVADIESDLHGIDILDATRAIAVGTTGHIWRTTDSGTTWTRVNAGVNALFEDVDWVTPNLIVAVGDGIVLRSTNGGTSWTRDAPKDHFYGVHFSDETHGWIVGDSIDDDSIFRTVDGGATWLGVEVTYPNVQYVKAVHFRTPNYGWIVGDRFRARTLDAGQSWDLWVDSSALKDITFLDDSTAWVAGDNKIGRIRRADESTALVGFVDYPQLDYPKAVGIRNEQTVVVVGANGIIVRTTDQGRTWTRPGDWPNVDLRAIDRLPSGVLWAVGASGTIIRSPDRGRNWTAYPSQGTGVIFDVDFVDEANGWIVGESGFIMATNDGGASWEEQRAENVGNLYAVRMVDVNTGWISGDLGKVFRTTNGGDTWTALPTPDPVSLKDIAHTGTRTYVAGGSKVFRRDDTATAWEPFVVDGATDLQAIEFGDPLRGWVGDTGAKIFSSANGGTTWSRQFPGAPLPFWDIDSVGPEVAWALGEGGDLHRTNNGGARWQSLNSGVSSALYGVSGDPDGYTAAVGALGVLRSTGPIWYDATRDNAPSFPHVQAGASLAAGDAVYIGQTEPYDSIMMRVDLPGTGAAIAWEYSSGNTWKPLAGQDGTSNYGFLGLGVIRFSIPGDWTAQGLHNDSTPRYWVRSRVLASATNSLMAINEVGTLRMLQPISGLPTGTSATTSSSARTSNTQRADFGMTASPTVVDFGRRERGTETAANLSLLAYRGTASAVLTIEGSAAPWLRPSASTFELRQGINQTVRLELRVPADAPPGPAKARVYVEAAPAGAFSVVTGWIDVSLTVAAADLVDASFLREPARWSARFANYLGQDARVTFDASLRAVGNAARATGSAESDVRSGTNVTVEGPLDVAALPAGPYDLRITSRVNETSHSRDLRVFLGGSPVAVEDLLVGVRPFEPVTFTFTLRNTASVPVVARPVVTVYDAGDVEVGTIAGAPVALESNESREVTVDWEPVFGVYRASVQAHVDNAEPSGAAEEPFVVRGSPRPERSVWEDNLPFFVILFVLIANLAAGLGLWTGKRA